MHEQYSQCPCLSVLGLSPPKKGLTGDRSRARRSLAQKILYENFREYDHSSKKSYKILDEALFGMRPWTSGKPGPYLLISLMSMKIMLTSVHVHKYFVHVHQYKPIPKYNFEYGSINRTESEIESRRPRRCH